MNNQITLASLCAATEFDQSDARTVFTIERNVKITLPFDAVILTASASNLNSKVTVVFFGESFHIGYDYVDLSVSPTKKLKVFSDEFNIHSNMLEYAEMFHEKHSQDVSQSLDMNHPSLIFCGYHFGGCIAQLVALKYLSDKIIPQEKIKCICFGSPLFADARLDNFISEKLLLNFHNYVLDCDIIPRILLIPTGYVKDLKTKHSYEDFFETSYLKYFLESNRDVGSFITLTPIRRDSKSFVPCGNYTFIERPVALNNNYDKTMKPLFFKYSDMEGKISKLEELSWNFRSDKDTIDGYIESFKTLVPRMKKSRQEITSTETREEITTTETREEITTTETREEMTTMETLKNKVRIFILFSIPFLVLGKV